jgi:hypothetical protein
MPFGQFSVICVLSNGSIAAAYALLHVLLADSISPLFFTAGAGIAVPFAGLLLLRAATRTSNG